MSPDNLPQGSPRFIKIPATEPKINIDKIPIIIKTDIWMCLLQLRETTTNETAIHDTPMDINIKEQTTIRPSRSPIIENIFWAT